MTLAFVAMSGAALAQSDTTSSKESPISIQSTNPAAQTPVMTHEIASLIQTLQKAQVQYRRSGQSQDLARVEAMRRELASRGFNKV